VEAAQASPQNSLSNLARDEADDSGGEPPMILDSGDRKVEAERRPSRIRPLAGEPLSTLSRSRDTREKEPRTSHPHVSSRKA